VAAAIESIGGEARLASLRAIKVETIGHEWALEQSERPEGPWMAHYIQRTELRDATGGRLRRESQTRDWNFPQWTPPLSLIVTGPVAAHTIGERWRAGTGADLDDAARTLALAPERLLLTARAASDLKSGPSKTLQGSAHHSVTFTWRNQPVTVYLNSWTHRPTLLEMVRDDPFGIWGDVTERRWFSWWDLHSGLWYPRQVSVEWNGQPFSDTSTMAPTQAVGMHLPPTPWSEIAAALREITVR
jgi:hypothetical protein